MLGAVCRCHGGREGTGSLSKPIQNLLRGRQAGSGSVRNPHIFHLCSGFCASVFCTFWPLATVLGQVLRIYPQTLMSGRKVREASMGEIQQKPEHISISMRSEYCPPAPFGRAVSLWQVFRLVCSTVPRLGQLTICPAFDFFNHSLEKAAS